MKILIVEDEQLIRESIAGSVEQLGSYEIAEAANGLEALEVMKGLQPDIIFADIKMPKMDGLQLLSEIRKQSYNVVFIIISGYDSFEYAQEALQLGAFSYLLKPVNDHDLADILSRAEKTICQARLEMDSAIQYKIHARKYMELSKKQFLFDLLRSSNPETKDLEAQMQELGIFMEHDNFMAAVSSIDDYNELYETLSDREMKALKFSIENIVSELLSDSDIRAYSFETDDGQAFLLNFSENSSAPSKGRIFESLQKARDFIGTHMNFTVTIGVGPVVHTLDRLHESYNKACKAVLTRLTRGCNQVYICESPESIPKKTVLIGLDTEQKLLANLEKCDRQAVLDIIEELYGSCSAYEISQSDFAAKLNFQLVCTLYHLMEQMGIDLEPMLGNEIKIYHQVNLCSSRDKILLFFSGVVDTCINQLEGAQASWNKKLMGKAAEYILDNYDKDIGLNSVAEFVSVSPSYFSKLFKDEYRDSFTDYLVKLRINKARDLLKEGSYMVNEVAKRVGFNDEKYFYRVFKKFTGFTPGNYKKI